ncbi:MAG: starch-binding protein [Candidatus Nanosyncoccaceae bacterium]
MKKTKYLLIALVLALAGGALLLGDETRALSTYKNIRELKTGDIIYYDNSGTNWDEVRVYLFSKNGGSERFDWNSRPTMTRIGETDVYKYEITNDLNIENYKDDHVIFSNNAGNQTIDLGFIETGYAYLVDSEENGKARGYWYVYDKSELVSLIRSAKEYEAYSDYLSSASYDELATQIRNAEGVVNSEVRVKTNPNGSGFYTDFDIALEDLEKSINDLEIDTGKLEEILDSDEIADIDRDKYTDDSLKDLDDAIERAKDILDNPDSTLEDIKNAADDVLEVIGNLEEKAPIDTNEKTPEDSTPANPSTRDNIEVAAAGIGISSAVGYALYIVAKQRR